MDWWDLFDRERGGERRGTRISRRVECQPYGHQIERILCNALVEGLMVTVSALALRVAA